MENHSYDEIIGSSAAPHINALASSANSAVFTRSFAIEHPSQPNYLDLYSGSNQGVTGDGQPSNLPFTTANLGRELIDAGYSFATYSEDLPGVGYSGAVSSNELYAQKHNPASEWMGTGTNQISDTTNQPFTAFPSDFTKLPTVCYVIPNLDDDMHNGTDPSTIIQGDAWVYDNLNAYIQWGNTHNSLFIITFDEDDNSPVNQIPTIFSGKMVMAGQYSETINHFSVLRTIEDMYGLPHAGSSATATSITDVWTASSSVATGETPEHTTTIFAHPNPFTNSVTIQTWMQNSGTAEVSILNGLGVEVAHLFSGELCAGEHSFEWDAGKNACATQGMYECLVRINGQVETLPVVLMR
jgi:acid phosphatase